MTEYIDIDKLTPDPFQPRQVFEPSRLKELAASIRIHGVVVPLIVESKEGVYIICDGERRYRASKMIGLKEVPVKIIDAMGDTERLIMRFQLQEQNEHWDGFDKARVIQKLHIDTGMSKEEIAKILGIHKATITNYLILLKLSKRAQQVSVNKNIPITYFREIERTKRTVADLDLAEKLEKTLIEMLSDGVFTDRSVITDYARAIRTGGDKIAEKIVSDNTYTSARAMRESHADQDMSLRSINSLSRALINKLKSVVKAKIKLDSDYKETLAKVKNAINEAC